MSNSERTVCDTELWNIDLFWNTQTPRLTPCFQQSVLSIVPSVALFIMWIGKILIRPVAPVSTEPKKQYPFTILYISKLIISALLAALCAVEVMYYLYRVQTTSGFVPLIHLYSPLVRLVALVLAIVLQVQQFKNIEVSSAILSAYWCISFLCGFFSSPLFDIITDAIDETTEAPLFIITSLSFSFIFIAMLLSFFTDPGYDMLWDKKSDEYIIEHQSVLSRLLFSWINRLMVYGYKNEIKLTDIDPTRPFLQSVKTYEDFQTKWTHELDKKKRTDASTKTEPSLSWALFRTLWYWMAAAACLELVYDFLILLPPLILDALIAYTEDLTTPTWHGVVFSLGLFLCTIATCVLQQQHVNYTIIAFFIPKMSLTAAIYRKSLKLSNSARLQYTVGEMCNLIAVDTQEVIQFMFSANLLWSAPLRIVLFIILLWQYLGWACLVGVAVMVLVLPATVLLARKTQHEQSKQMQNKDWRLRQMADILNGIKILKLFAWEKAFLKRISDVRDKEIDRIKKLALINAVIVFLWSTTPFLVAITSFVTFVLIDEKNVLNTSIAFVSLTLFNQLRGALSAIPDVITDFIQSQISLGRLRKYLCSEELKSDTIDRNVQEGDSVMLDSCSFSWSSGEEPFLKDISATVPEGRLVAIVGQVGSGKSALLSAILGEMHKVSGKINVKEGDIGYISQQAWIQNATLQENVLFRKRMMTSRYNDVLQRCCLEDDLKILPDGDQTEIGEKGINLSGGQKQRISLARAVYHDASIYLLDDPLSAVDAHVGIHIFNEVIGPKGILRNKTRLLVTHKLSILAETDLIWAMADGKIQEIGTYEQLMARGGEFAKFVEEHHKKAKEEAADEDEKDEVCLSPKIKDSSITLSTKELKEQMKTTGRRLSRTRSTIEATKPKKKKKVLIEAEKMEIGKVKASVFLIYFRYATFYLISLMITAFLVYQGFEISANFWLSWWSSDPVLEDGSQDVTLRNMRIAVYGLLGFGQGLSILLASVLLAYASTRATKLLHSRMLTSILRSPLVFFEKTPSGRILNRFGKDVNIVDTNIPYAMNRLISCIIAVIGTLIVIAINEVIFIAVISVLAIFYYIIQSYYLETSRQVRRLHSITLSPVMSNFSETIQGASTIRAFRAEKFFINKEDMLVDDNARAHYCSTVLNRWLPVRLQFTGSLLILSVALLTVFGRDTVTPGTAGLMLTYAMNMTSVLASLVKFSVILEIRMVSVERIAEYSELPSEASWESTKMLPKTWPSEGSVVFKDYQMRYQNDLNLVLKDINIAIVPGQKVGVVGRTGAGKSTLALALFRIVEPAGGAILIDDVNISQLGLHELRSRVTIIPQDPILFNGTIRFNLDPLNDYTDDTLWIALDNAHLKSFIASTNEGLDYNLSGGGDNLSVGQRQQLCLARALLKKTKVLVLDEATAAVDMETDRLIQSTIRREFEECTVITIAHRLYTILDYDRIIVMDSGKIVEDGTPDDLLQNEDSHFFKLSKDSGLV